MLNTRGLQCQQGLEKARSTAAGGEAGTISGIGTCAQHPSGCQHLRSRQRLTTNSEVTHAIGEQGGAFFHLEPHAVQDQLPIRGVPVLEVFSFYVHRNPRP